MTGLPLQRNVLLDGAWSCDEAATLYGIDAWGKGYFGVNQAGHLTVMPTGEQNRAIDLHGLVEGLRERGLHPPLLLRFSDLVRQRLLRLRDAFKAAIDDNDYQGRYRCVYPIKVNQQRHLCEEIRDFSAEIGFGLEVGSKPELLAVLGLSVGFDDMPIVCNGFKDREFIQAVVLAAKLGRRIIPVVERYRDIELIAEEARRLDTRPAIGLRIKPSARGTGKWASSAGMRSKFGLTASEALRALEHLRSHDMTDCLKMVHFHLGSQLSDIRRLKSAISELAHFYCELHRLGAGVETIDVGGGLGIDYDGSRTAYDSSVNYDVDEYASDIVYRIKTACDHAGVPHPEILSESGRSIAAYSSVLVFDVQDRFSFDVEPDLDRARQMLEQAEDRPQPMLDLIDAYERVGDQTLVEVFHDAVQARDEAANLFAMGYLTLPMRAEAERLFWSIGKRILRRVSKLGKLPEDLADLARGLSDIYYCNFSVFQSMPDAWAIDHLFPIVPLHRLDEKPTRSATLADMTCDSDGKIDRFVHRREIKQTLELHELKPGEPYYLAACLVGAYQEVLGDLHNLFGDTHVVHIALDEKEGWSLGEVIQGDTVREVLGYVGYTSTTLTRALRRDVERATRAGRITVTEGRALLEFYERAMAGYTYLA